MQGALHVNCVLLGLGMRKKIALPALTNALRGCMDPNLDQIHTLTVLIAQKDISLTKREQQFANCAQMELLPTLREALSASHVILGLGVTIVQTSAVKEIMQIKILALALPIVKSVIQEN